MNVNHELNHNLTRQELNQQLNLKTTHSKLLKIHQLRTLREILVANPEALTAFHILMDERHERAEVNSKQALEISRKEALIKKLEGFVDLSNSEILNLGKFIWSALKKTGLERKNELFKHDLDTSLKQEARRQGYYNVGWDKVQNSWRILGQFSSKVVSMFENKLNKGDVVGAINIAILEADRGLAIAHEAIENLQAAQEKLNNITDEALSKYPLL